MRHRLDNIPEDCLSNGIYFESGSDVSTHYFIQLLSGRYEGNALIKIWTMEAPDDDENFKAGDEIKAYDGDLLWVCDINLCGKYFFPTFSNEMQLYYDDEKYYGGECKTNSITSLMECVNFGIEYGLKKSGIKPY